MRPLTLGVIVVLVALVLQQIPVSLVLQEDVKFTNTFIPYREYEGDERWKDVSFYVAEGKKFPLVITPRTYDFNSPVLVGDEDFVVKFATEHAEWLRERMDIHGALLFRGFNLTQALQFEKIALLLEPNLEKFYLGTSPRTPIPGTDYVFTASDFPPPIAIPFHCEMSFLPSPPQKIFFFAYHPNTSPGGETPLSDFGALWNDLSDEDKKEWKTKSIRNIRKYPSNETTSWDPFQTKDWQTMFLTTSKSKVEEISAAQGLKVEWDNSDTLKLTNVQEVTRVNPRTKQEIWHNHLLTFHISSIPMEYKFTALRLNSWKYTFFHWGARLVSSLFRIVKGDEELSQHASYGDHSPIPQEKMDQLRSLAWKHGIIYSHRLGDVVAIDNWRIAHGRQPYSGYRKVMVAWSKQD